MSRPPSRQHPLTQSAMEGIKRVQRAQRGPDGYHRLTMQQKVLRAMEAQEIREASTHMPGSSNPAGARVKGHRS